MPSPPQPSCRYIEVHTDPETGLRFSWFWCPDRQQYACEPETRQGTPIGWELTVAPPTLHRIQWRWTRRRRRDLNATPLPVHTVAGGAGRTLTVAMDRARDNLLRGLRPAPLGHRVRWRGIA